MTDIPINPGIRRTVAFLNANGFRTTDSGDGETHACECDRDTGYVTIVVEPRDMVAEAHRLAVTLARAGVTIGPVNEDGSGVAIQANYDPSDGVAILDVSGIHDRMLTPQTLREQVREFMLAMGQPVLDSPQVPADDRVRLRMKLIAEEFFEILEATFRVGDYDGMGAAMTTVMNCINESRIAVDLPELADGFGDLDYVVEGARAELGLNGEPIAAAIHAANMAKLSGPVRADGKKEKPPGWTPPDIAGVLKAQGWKGDGQ